MRPPVGLFERLAADVVQGEAGGLQGRLVGPDQRSVELQDADESEEVVEHVAKPLLARPQGSLGGLTLGEVEDEGDAFLAPRPDHAVADEDRQRRPVLAEVCFLVRRAPAGLSGFGDGRLVPGQELRRRHLEPADAPGLKVFAAAADHGEKGVVGIDDVTADRAADHADRNRLDEGAITLLALAVAGDLRIVGDGGRDPALIVNWRGADQNGADDAVPSDELQLAADLRLARQCPVKRRLFRRQAAAGLIEVRPLAGDIGKELVFQITAEKLSSSGVDQDQAFGLVADDDWLRRLAEHLLEQQRRNGRLSGEAQRASQRHTSMARTRVTRCLLFCHYRTVRCPASGRMSCMK